MRHPIEKSPRDGTAIILKDDASGTTNVAHWSTEAGEWLGENGEPTKITPTHWYPLARDQYRLRENERSLLAASSFIVILGATTLIATHFSAEVAAYVTRYTGHEVMHEQESRLANQGSRKSSLVAQQQAEADQASAPAEAQQVAQVQRISLVSVPEAQPSLKEDRTEGWAQEPTEARRAIEGLDMQLQAEAGQSTRSLQEEREKASALALEAAVAREELAASTEQHRHALEEERARSAALASELATAQREIETQATQLQKAVGEAEQQKQAAENTIAELQQSLQQERHRIEAMARDLATVQRTMDGRVTVGRSADSHVVHGTQAVKTAATEPLKAEEAQGSAESAKLIARARVLLGQGNIGAARIVLERAAESGNAQASFMLAETYDPVILSAWGTYGTRGEAAKAREYYAKAHTGGIREAKDRLDALRQ